MDTLPTNLIHNDSLWFRMRAGVLAQNNDVALYGFANFKYKTHFYGYLYPRIVNRSNVFPRYTGKPRNISRFGLNSGETDLSGIGFENDWLLFQLGRGRQSWGAGNDIQMALSENSPAYDYGMLSLDFGKIRVRYIHGFLESDSLSNNRYITGRGIEFSNRRSLVFGLSEIVVYSGKNRPFDLAYLNPISTHLEIELNDRQNQLGTDSGNGVWQGSIDWMTNSDIRLSGNLLFDEFVLDDVEKDSGKVHGMGWSVRAAWTPIKEKEMITIFGSWIHIGSHTFRHEVGYNNFVLRNKPLGWQYGSDGEEIKIGLNYFNFDNLICELGIGIRQIGSNSIKDTPYEPYYTYKAGPFPSGEVNESAFFSGRIQWWWQPHVSIMSEIKWRSSNIEGEKLSVKIGFDIYYPKSFNI